MRVSRPMCADRRLHQCRGDNPSGTLPASSVVWYQNETDKATAEDVATTLGISAVEQVQGLAVPITVVLLN